LGRGKEKDNFAGRTRKKKGSRVWGTWSSHPQVNVKTVQQEKHRKKKKGGVGARRVGEPANGNQLRNRTRQLAGVQGD